MRIAVLTALVLVAGAVAACGGDSEQQGAPGSASNPLVALPNPSGTRSPPTAPRNEAAPRSSSAGEQSSQQDREEAAGADGAKTQRAERKTRSVQSKATGEPTQTGSARKQKAQRPSAKRPCSLVTRREAAAIIGAPIGEPVQAPQGPTCIYRARAGGRSVSLVVQTADFSKLRGQLRKRRSVRVGERTAYCGQHGRAMLYLRVSARRVLSIAAPCATATAFASRAAARL